MATLMRVQFKANEEPLYYLLDPDPDQVQKAINIGPKGKGGAVIASFMTNSISKISDNFVMESPKRRIYIATNDIEMLALVTEEELRKLEEQINRVKHYRT